MFTISVRVSHVVFNGLEALDKRRSLGLSDGSYLSFEYEHNRTSQKVSVSEGVARRFFGPTSTHQLRDISFDWLVTGEVTTTKGEYVELSLSEERIRELFIFAECGK